MADDMDHPATTPPMATTGIDGLDQVLRGGLTPNRIYLVEGVPGSGKTTLALQFLMEGARRGEPVLYVTLSETAAELRGDQCTSADAAGFPIAPLLFTADEVAAGEIAHAIRFILPNDRVRRGYVRPATHGTSTTGGTNAPAYGVHFRLRADYPVDSLPAGARVVARAMQKYGMYHADGGNIALTAASDRYTTAKWDGLLDPQDLAALRVEDFEVIDEGGMITLTYDCARN